MPRLSIVLNAVAIAATLTTLGCATAGTTGAPTPVNDPRVGLKAGRTDAAQALGNLRMTGHAESPPNLAQQMNSDLAFTGNYAVQGIFANDLPKIMGVTLLAAFFVVVANLVVDLLYAVVDPRVRTR